MKREWGNEEETERKWRENEEMEGEWGNQQRMRKWKEDEEINREWGNGEKMRKWKEIHSLYFLTFSVFPHSLSISYIKNCLILSQNVKYGTFVANITENLTYTLWENDSGPNTLREISASCAGLIHIKLLTLNMVIWLYGWQVSGRQEPKIVQTLFVHKKNIFCSRP